MKPNYYISLMLLLLTVTACNNQGDDQQINNEHMLFSSHIKTKIDHSIFATTDAIGLYIVERKTSGLQDNESENMTLAIEKNLRCTTGDDGYLIINKFIDYPVNNIDAHAYFPYEMTAATGTKENIRTITIKADQTKQSDYFLSDFKKATKINWVKPDPNASIEDKAIPLTFHHQLSKISLRFKSSTKSIAELKTLIQGVKFKNVALTGTFDMMTNIASANLTSIQSNTITPYGVLAEKNNMLIGLEAILMPCQATDAPIIVIESDDGAYTAKLNQTLEQGKDHLFTITINDGGEISYTVTLLEWDSTSSSGSMEEVGL